MIKLIIKKKNIIEETVPSRTNESMDIVNYRE